MELLEDKLVLVSYRIPPIGGPIIMATECINPTDCGLGSIYIPYIEYPQARVTLFVISPI